MHHKSIKRFGFDGEIGDCKDFIRTRETFAQMILTQMREDGYVPVLDIGPLWSTSYKAETQTFDFIISLYGVYVGTRKAQEIEGFDGYGNMYIRE